MELIELIWRSSNISIACLIFPALLQKWKSASLNWTHFPLNSAIKLCHLLCKVGPSLTNQLTESMKPRHTKTGNVRFECFSWCSVNDWEFAEFEAIGGIQSYFKSTYVSISSWNNWNGLEKLQDSRAGGQTLREGDADPFASTGLHGSWYHVRDQRQQPTPSRIRFLIESTSASHF